MPSTQSSVPSLQQLASQVSIMRSAVDRLAREKHDVLTASEVATRLRLSVPLVRKLARNGVIQSRVFGRKRLFYWPAVLASLGFTVPGQASLPSADARPVRR